MKFERCSKEEFLIALESSDNNFDKFAKTFLSKANMQDQWDKCFGAFNGENELMGAIILTVSKRQPYVANLQLLHTFYKHRKMGVGRFLCEKILEIAKDLDAEYFRVSSEKSAIKFYESLGLKMLGEQKSGCQLSMCKIRNSFEDSEYSLDFETINKAVFKKGKGGCIKIFNQPKEIND